MDRREMIDERKTLNMIPIQREKEQALDNRKRRKKERKRRRMLARIRLVGKLCLLIILVLIICCGISLIGDMTGNDYEEVLERRRMINENDASRPKLIEDYIEVNPYSRPGDTLREVNAIFVHYTANPGTSAEQNRSYFASLAETKERSASAHFVIGYDGTIIQCIPLDEIAYAVKGRNEDSISIECCYQDENGKFTEETYRALLELTGWLMNKYDLTTDEVLRHYDEGGKKCPLYYVENENAWEQFKADVVEYIK